MQNIFPRFSSISRQIDIAEISRSLKALAIEMNVPLIVCSQLNRQCEFRADRRPVLSDIRESGAIEQDADLVTFLYRDEYYNPNTDKVGHTEVIIAKHNNGAIGTVELRYLWEYTKFVNPVTAE
jgi:replicative DNA helicase